MRRGLTGADDPADFLASGRVRLRPGVHHEHHDMPNDPDRLPSFFVGVWVASTGRQGIAEYQLRRLETHLMIAFVDPVLFVCPYPPQNCPRPAVEVWRM